MHSYFYTAEDFGVVNGIRNYTVEDNEDTCPPPLHGPPPVPPPSVPSITHAQTPQPLVCLSTSASEEMWSRIGPGRVIKNGYQVPKVEGGTCSQKGQLPNNKRDGLP